MRSEQEIRDLIKKIRAEKVIVSGYKLVAETDAGGWWLEVLEWVLNDKRRKR